MNKEKLKIVVAIDGGGIRGVLPLLLLQHLESLVLQKGLNRAFSSTLDLVSGTSTGAIILAGLTAKKNQQYIYTIEQLLSLYRERGPQLFNLSQPGHPDSDGLRLLLKRKFKGLYLSDLSTDFAFVSYDKTDEKPFIFTKEKVKTNTTSISLTLAACSAIPGFFLPVQFQKHELIDGVIFAKNPAEIAFQYLQEHYPEDQFLFVSLGTGKMVGEMYDEMEQEVDRVDSHLLSLAKNNYQLTYFRLQPDILNADPKMDNASAENISLLIKDGENYIAQNKELFESLAELWWNSSK